MGRPFLDVPSSAPLMPAFVVAETAERYGLTLRSVRSGDRHKTVARARRHAAFALRDECNLSWTEIARVLGYRDHTTPRTQAKLFAREAGLVGWRG